MTDQTPKAPKRPRHDYFDDTDVAENIGSRIVHGSAFVFGSSIAKFLIGLGGTAVLARLLDPEAYGLLAMVFVVTNFLMLFRDMNLSLATVQQHRITHAQVSTIYWINVAITVLISVIILSIAPVIAWFYDEPRLTGIAALLTLSILLRGLAAQHQALLRRKMRFGAVGMLQIVSMAAGYVIAITLAWYGYRYWSLVWLHIGMAFAELVLSWIATGWRPGRPVRGSGVRKMLVFGGNLTGYTIFRFVSRSLDNAIIGWFWGASVLGIYAKSRDTLSPITSYVSAPFGAVAIPSLSRVINEPARYRTIFRQLAEKIAVMSLFTAVLLGFAANDVVAVLLGPKWVAAGPIIATLAVLIFTESMAGCINWLFISQGRGGQLFRYSVIGAVTRIAAVLGGLSWGIAGIAAALTLTAVVIQFPALIWYGCSAGPVRQRDVYGMLFPIVIGSVIGLGAVAVVAESAHFENPVLSLLTTASILAVVQIAGLLATGSGRQMFRDLRRGLEILFRGQAARGSRGG